MSRRTMLVIAVVALAMLMALAVATLLNRPPAPAPNITASATPTPGVDPATVAQVKGYSDEFTTRYLTYQRPNAPEYLESLKPYLSDSLYQQTVSGSASAGAASAPPQQGAVQNMSAVPDGGKVAVTVTAQVNQPGIEPYSQTLLLTWEQQQDRWRITDIKLLKSTRKYPYLEQ